MAEHRHPWDSGRSNRASRTPRKAFSPTEAAARGKTGGAPSPARTGGEGGRGRSDSEPKARILLVDDEPLVLEGVQLVLEKLGYGVTALSDSPEALLAFNRAPDQFDLVITDQVMPKLTGTRLAHEILEARPGMPILLLSGFVDAVDEEQAKVLGIRIFLRKPFLTRELAEAVELMLSSSLAFKDDG